LTISEVVPLTEISNRIEANRKNDLEKLEEKHRRIGEARIIEEGRMMEIDNDISKNEKGRESYLKALNFRRSQEEN